MIVKLLTEHHLELLSLKEGCKGLSESTHVKIPHRSKSHRRSNEPVQDKMISEFSKDSDQPVNSPSLIGLKCVH